MSGLAREGGILVLTRIVLLLGIKKPILEKLLRPQSQFTIPVSEFHTK